MAHTQFEVYKMGGWKKWKKQVMLIENFEMILFNVSKTKKAEVSQKLQWRTKGSLRNIIWLIIMSVLKQRRKNKN